MHTFMLINILLIIIVKHNKLFFNNSYGFCSYKKLLKRIKIKTVNLNNHILLYNMYVNVKFIKKKKK